MSATEYRHPGRTLDQRVEAFLGSEITSPVTRGLVIDLVAALAEQGEPEWEYGARHSQGTNPHPSRRAAEEMVVWHSRGEERKRPEARGKVALVRRRPAGPWVPVEENGESNG